MSEAPPVLQPSPLDSARFDLQVWRGRAPQVDAKTLAAQILQARCDVAILRTPAGAASGIAGLARWALPVLHADTLVYYRCDLDRYAPAPLRNADLAFSLGTPDDLPELRVLIAHTFSQYVAHYHANPLFGREQILAGYQQWAENHVTDAGSTLWVARREGRIVAFAACHEHAGHEHAGEGHDAAPVFEGVLYGVAPDAAGGGLYGDLIRHTQAVARSRGAREMKVSTQVHNYAVQKVWAREGFHLFEALDTWHVNALLSAGQTIVDRPLTFSAEQIRRFAEVSGDANPLHVDAAAARAAGFPGCIAHGVLAATELSRVLGTDAPGPGTIIRHLEQAFLRPLLADVAYRLVVRIPGGLRESGPMQAVAQVLDEDGQTCMLARSDILRRR
ncbi:bifunctional GNAT family N-acetyltransferase/hotdog fold thioesterase [Agrilutibacter solisilvae]|uniref:GNAT family N-acetyltransferase n=1 Tax=Agrilutibacter solisilvae TaxID=2763317 RepID=A0A974Y1S3_9GAMM|nr:bifunctional GNAT family N-acetyltransferase/hotdog fold thioesterase [Lysobacter solisilvae]QSX79663.1 GNAT family N-acetyltransferase [Lysobacter solisilvae]